MSLSQKARDAAKSAIFRVPVVLLLVLLVGTVGAAADVSISVVVPDVQDPGRSYYADVVVPAFERETGIKVELELRDWGGYMDYLLTRFAAGDAPDVIQIGGEALGTFVRNGLVQPLDRWASEWGELDDFARAAVLDGMVDGRLYILTTRRRLVSPFRPVE